MTQPRGWWFLGAGALILAACTESIAPPEAVKLAFTVQPITSMAGVAIGPAVAVAIEDASGTTVTGATNVVTVTIGANPEGDTLMGTARVAAVNGVAVFPSLHIDKAGAGYTLKAAATGLTGATSDPFTIAPGPASRLVFTVQPSDAMGGAAITPPVQVAAQDAYGNLVTGFQDSVTVALGGNPAPGALSGTTVVSAVGGVATFSDLSIGPVHAGYTLTASAAGLTGASSVPFAIAAPLASTIAVGYYHTCALDGAGAAYCWGYGSSGALGNGSFASTSSPVAVSGGLTFSALTAGGFHTCALTSAGAAYCWGWNATGQLGDGSLASSATPVAVSGGMRFSALTAGGRHTCGLSAGVAYCWGANFAGQLGDGSLTQSSTPVAVSRGLTFFALAAGWSHTCGRTTAGAAYCWGLGATGALGNGSLENSATPVAVSGGLTFSVLATGAYHTCGLSDGVAWCWGENEVGQLGNGSFTQTATPAVVSGGLRFSALAAGATGTCAVVRSGGFACWGANNLGQLGIGRVSEFGSSVPVTGGQSFSAIGVGAAHACGRTSAGSTLFCWGDNYDGQLGNGAVLTWAPQRVSGMSTASLIKAGGAHTCALDLSGAASCWGANDQGQLGSGAVSAMSTTPLLVTGGRSFSTLTTGGFHSCGATASGAAYCWGNNDVGQLGDSSTTSSPFPVAVYHGVDYRALTAEDFESENPAYRGHTCALSSSGAAFCWGANLFGDLGNGTNGWSLVPVPVSGGLTFTALDVGFFHSCGLSDSGTGYCWGANDGGQLGTGDRAYSPTPVLVTGGLSFVALATGADHTCGLTGSGAIYCWGCSNTLFPCALLGDGSFDGSVVPVLVSGGLNFSALDAGVYHTCGLTTSGAAYCWGDNEWGQLGDGSFDGSAVPVAVAGGLSFSALTTGAYHTCGLSAGAAYCWGDNDFGQLGRGTLPYSTVPAPVLPFTANASPSADVASSRPLLQLPASLLQSCSPLRFPARARPADLRDGFCATPTDRPGGPLQRMRRSMH
jgi:alpha-tubulin suppressor-like RCC1 family protein